MYVMKKLANENEIWLAKSLPRQSIDLCFLEEALGNGSI